jgi:hypothetical protein
MNKPRIDLAYVGPLKRGDYARSENPLEEDWLWISRFGIASWLQKISKPTAHSWTGWQSYSVVRVRQAVEFRAAARSGSILTRPLPLYYSLLNLLRGFLASREGIESKKSHGLTFVEGSQVDIFQTGAKIAKGTFTDYLDALKVPYQEGTVITLHESLLKIVETANYFTTASLGPAEVFQVNVLAYQVSHKVLLHFYGPGEETDFRNSWQQWFPKLKDICSLEPTDRILLVDTSKIDTTTYQAVCDFCHQFLEVNLKSYEDPAWFAIRYSKPELDLPRPAFYFVAAFILSSVVRYKPEFLLNVSNLDSEHGWLIERFLNAAERYFPQLLLHLISTNPVYF